MKKILIALMIILAFTLSGCTQKEKCVDMENRTAIDWDLEEELLELDNGIIVKPVSENCFIEVVE